MSRITNSTTYPPTQEEIAHWAREAEYFTYKEPNPNAPSGTAAARGWGVPKEYKPPPDAMEYITAVYKRDAIGVGVDVPLRPEYKWSIFSVCLAHFLWLRTEDGAAWLLRFYGVEEVPPFKDAYSYFFVNKEVQVGGQPSLVALTEANGLQLRIFRSCERELNPPVSSEEDGAIRAMQDLLRKARDPNARELIAEATTEMYAWVSEQLRDWFLEPKADPRWPTYKSNRISGPQWARDLKRANGSPFFEALTRVESGKGRAYRVKDGAGAVQWLQGEVIRIIPRVDMARLDEGLSEHHIESLFSCSSCGKIRTCTPVTKSQQMCCHCFGSIVERDQRPTLDWCTMKECKHCPDHLENGADLINLKNRLNREAQFPVRR